MTELEKKIKQNALDYIEGCNIDKMNIPDCETYLIPIPYTLDGVRGYAIDTLVFNTEQKKFVSVMYYCYDGGDGTTKTIEL